MKLTCPSCHTIFHLEAAMEEAAGREFTAFIADLGQLARPMVAYLGLFRPVSRALAYERMLRLAREVVELSSDNVQLATALSETVEAIRKKRAEGKNQPLKNHNYLKQVLGNPRNEERGARFEGSLETPASAAPASKTARAIGRLQSRKSS
jgi:hypothetical protein